MCSVDELSEKSALLDRDGKSNRKRGFITIEPMVFLHSFGWSLSEVMLTNQIVYQSCQVKLGSRADQCSILGTDTNVTLSTIIEEVVQPYAASTAMAIVLLTSVVPAIVALFFGPWSDRFGRKPVIAVASIGYLITNLLIAFVSYLSRCYVLTPWLYVAANVPVAILGGFSVFHAGIFSFMNDITNAGNRTVRMGILQGFVMLGVLGGLLISSWAAKFTTVTTMFCISALLNVISVSYLFMATKESLPVDKSVPTRRKVAAIFNLGLIRDILRTFTRIRPNHRRTIIWALMAIGGMVEFAAAGKSLFFLYTRREFGWTIESYSRWLAAELGVIMLGNLFGISLLRRLFDASNIAILTISTVNHLGDYLIKGFANQGWQLYLTTFTLPFKGIDNAATLSILSTILPNEEVGKAYSMGLSIKAVTPLFSVFLLTTIYNHTIDTIPSVYLFVTSVAFVFNLVLIGLVKYLLGTSHKECNNGSVENNNSD